MIHDKPQSLSSDSDEEPRQDEFLGPGAIRFGKADFFTLAGVLVGLIGYFVVRFGGCLTYLVIRPCDVVAGVIGILLGITAIGLLIIGRIIQRKEDSKDHGSA